MPNLKTIHIGKLINQRVIELDLNQKRICQFLNSTELQIEAMYNSESLDTEMLLKWSKLLEYDFFRLYTHHLILYAPSSSKSNENKVKTTLPQFRKNIYTTEIIDFILEMIATGEKTKKQIIEEYRIPKTTLYKWIDKYSN